MAGPTPPRDAVRGKYDSPLFALAAEAWAGNFHMGWFESPDEPLATAGERATAMMAEAVAPQPGARVVEVACGIGGTARHLARRHGADVVATNLSAAQCAQGRAITAAEGLADSIRFAAADYHALPFRNRTFDVWWNQEALLYSTDKERVFREALRVLRPGGCLMLSDLVVSDEAPDAAVDELGRRISAPGFWSPGRYRALFGRLGLRVRRERDGFPHVAATFDRVLGRLAERRERFAAELGTAEPVDAMMGRLALQRDRAAQGHLGWAWWVLDPSG